MSYECFSILVENTGAYYFETKQVVSHFNTLMKNSILHTSTVMLISILSLIHKMQDNLYSYLKCRFSKLMSYSYKVTRKVSLWKCAAVKELNAGWQLKLSKHTGENWKQTLRRTLGDKAIILKFTRIQKERIASTWSSAMR